MCSIDCDTLFYYVLLLESYIKCYRKCNLLDDWCNKDCANCSLFSKLGSAREHRAAVGSALCSLKKQIPVRLKYIEDDYVDGNPVYGRAYCPMCEREFIDGNVDWKSEYCPECGQRLDWTMDN